MKIYTGNSARGYSCQIQRIEDGFVKLGHEITSYPGEADLIYQNNAPFDQIIKDKELGNFKPDAKIIFTILDIPEHLIRIGKFDLEALANQLTYADSICSLVILFLS